MVVMQKRRWDAIDVELQRTVHLLLLESSSLPDWTLAEQIDWPNPYALQEELEILWLAMEDDLLSDAPEEATQETWQHIADYLWEEEEQSYRETDAFLRQQQQTTAAQQFYTQLRQQTFPALPAFQKESPQGFVRSPPPLAIRQAAGNRLLRHGRGGTNGPREPGDTPQVETKQKPGAFQRLNNAYRNLAGKVKSIPGGLKRFAMRHRKKLGLLGSLVAYSVEKRAGGILGLVRTRDDDAIEPEPESRGFIAGTVLPFFGITNMFDTLLATKLRNNDYIAHEALPDMSEEAVFSGDRNQTDWFTAMKTNQAVADSATPLKKALIFSNVSATGLEWAGRNDFATRAVGSPRSMLQHMMGYLLLFRVGGVLVNRAGKAMLLLQWKLHEYLDEKFGKKPSGKYLLPFVKFGLHGVRISVHYAALVGLFSMLPNPAVPSFFAMSHFTLQVMNPFAWMRGDVRRMTLQSITGLPHTFSSLYLSYPTLFYQTLAANVAFTLFARFFMPDLLNYFLRLEKDPKKRSKCNQVLRLIIPAVLYLLLVPRSVLKALFEKYFLKGTVYRQYLSAEGETLTATQVLGAMVQLGEGFLHFASLRYFDPPITMQRDREVVFPITKEARTELARVLLEPGEFMATVPVDFAFNVIDVHAGLTLLLLELVTMPGAYTVFAGLAEKSWDKLKGRPLTLRTFLDALTTDELDDFEPAEPMDPAVFNEIQKERKQIFEQITETDSQGNVRVTARNVQGNPGSSDRPWGLDIINSVAEAVKKGIPKSDPGGSYFVSLLMFF